MITDRLWIINADCREGLKQLPDESVQCCVTSPPYWGLRDYGTATWDGGDEGCDHSVGGQVEDNKALGAITTGQRPGVDASQCRRCRARRIDSQLGLEKTPEEYVRVMVEVFREVKRVLKGDGTLWLNLGSSYATSGGQGEEGSSDGEVGRGPRSIRIKSNFKPKDMVPIPWMVAMALREDGWYLRSDIIWAKPNPMPESVTDRPTKSHEYLFLLTKNATYYYDSDAIREPHETRDGLAGGTWDERKANGHPMRYGFDVESQSSTYMGQHPNGRNKRSVWKIPTSPYPDAHFATFPPDLIKPCILAGTKAGDTVLDPFLGSGCTAMVSLELGRKCIGIELNKDYCELAEKRTFVTPGLAL